MKARPKEKQSNIQNFIQHVAEENYAMADKYLKAAVEAKILKRMNDNKPTNIFKNQ